MLKVHYYFLRYIGRVQWNDIEWTNRGKSKVHSTLLFLMIITCKLSDNEQEQIVQTIVVDWYLYSLFVFFSSFQLRVQCNVALFVRFWARVLMISMRWHYDNVIRVQFRWNEMKNKNQWFYSSDDNTIWNSFSDYYTFECGSQKRSTDGRGHTQKHTHTGLTKSRLFSCVGIFYYECSVSPFFPSYFYF